MMAPLSPLPPGEGPGVREQPSRRANVWHGGKDVRGSEGEGKQ
jgi:hypothetical protein